MTSPDGPTIDHREVLSTERIETRILTVDLCSDGDVSRNSRPGLVDWSGQSHRVQVDVPSVEGSPHDRGLRHLLSGLIAWTNSRLEFEGDLLSIDLDPEVESMRALGVQRGRDSRSARPTAFFTSAVVHMAFFVTLVFFPAPQVAGTFGYAGNVLSATIVSHEELIPQDEHPASLDSPASMPSIAKKSPERKKPDRTTAQQPPQVQEFGPHPTEIAMVESPEKPVKDQEKKDLDKAIPTRDDDPKGDALQNSLASAPSTASPERRTVPAAGQGGEVFDSLVLAAIREAIFFPKQAVQERRHGETVVSFSINRDHSISKVSVTKSSGFAILDEAAIRIIQNASRKFPPFPEGLSAEALHFVVPILFKEKKT